MKKLIVILVSIYSVFTTNLMAQVPNYVPTNGLVAWYPFTGNANDESGNGNNGTVNGATLTTDRFGNVNKAYSFDGVNDFIGTNLSGITGQNSRTISFWFNSNNNTSGIKTMVGYGEHASAVPQGSRFDCTIENGRPSIDIGYTFASYTVNNVQNNWKFYTVAYASSYGTTVQAINLYIDGVLQQNPSILNTSISINTGNLYKVFFGAPYTNPSGNSFNGNLDDIGIWNRVLTQQEITALYNACLNNITNITPQNNQVNIGNTATFTANTSAASPSYIWQSDLGQGFQTLNSVGKYSGTSTNNLSISNVQLTNHLDPIRAIITYGSCKDTSNIAYIKITDTCITKINDTIKITKYDTITTKITKYDTIKVMDTLVINANLSGISAPNNTNRIIVYPNPAKDHITIDYGVFSRMSGYTVKITNTLGQTVFSSPINQQTSYINLSTWTGKGLYYLQIIDPNSNMIENRKIVLQ
jgi:hypothetical protein